MRVHVTLDPHLVAWAHAQPGGLSETVGRLLAREHEQVGEVGTETTIPSDA